MPDVKWAESGFLLTAKDRAKYRGMVPVLTLDDIEAWLKEEREKEADGLRNPQYIMAIDDLLAQVQSWKAGA